MKLKGLFNKTKDKALKATKDVAFKATNAGKTAMKTLKTEQNVTVNTSSVEADIAAIKEAAEALQATVDAATKTTAENTRKGMPTEAEIEAMAEAMMNDVIAEEQAKNSTGNAQSDMFIHETDEELNKIKLAFINALDVLKRISGFNDIHAMIIDMFEENSLANELDDSGWARMSAMCKEKIDNEIKMLLAIGREDKVAVLEFFKQANIFEIVFTGISMIAYFAEKHLKSLGVKVSKNAIVKGALKAISIIAGAIKKGIKIVLNTTAWAASAFIALVLKLAFFVYSTIMDAVHKAKTVSE